MFVQVVTYSLDGITEEEYLDVANRLAPRTSNLPGLLAKVWLENPAGNRYGAVYFWEDAESMERFPGTDLFEGRTPEFADLRIEEFRALENLTAVTQPGLEILQPRRIGTAKAAASAGASSAAPDALETAPAPPTPRQPVAKKRTPPPAKKAPAKASKRSTKRSSGATA